MKNVQSSRYGGSCLNKNASIVNNNRHVQCTALSSSPVTTSRSQKGYGVNHNNYNVFQKNFVNENGPP